MGHPCTMPRPHITWYKHTKLLELLKYQSLSGRETAYTIIKYLFLTPATRWIVIVWPIFCRVLCSLQCWLCLQAAVCICTVRLQRDSLLYIGIEYTNSLWYAITSIPRNCRYIIEQAYCYIDYLFTNKLLHGSFQILPLHVTQSSRERLQMARTKEARLL